MLIDHRDFGDPKRALQLGVGLASPLWSTFFLAASAGVAYWAWSQWARRPVLEGAVDAPPPAPKPKARTPPALDLEAPPAATDATPPAVVPANDAPETEPVKAARPRAAPRKKAAAKPPAIKAPHEATVIEAVEPRFGHGLAADLAASAATPAPKPARPKAAPVKAAALPRVKTAAGPRKAKASARASVRRKARRDPA